MATTGSDYAGDDLDGDGLGAILIPHNSSGDIAIGGDYLPLVKPVPSSVFDTDSGTYPGMMGTHCGTIITCMEFRDANGRNYHDWIPTSNSAVVVIKSHYFFGNAFFFGDVFLYI